MEEDIYVIICTMFVLNLPLVAAMAFGSLVGGSFPYASSSGGVWPYDFVSGT